MCSLQDDRIIGEPEQILDKAPGFPNQRGCCFIAQAEALRAQANWGEALKCYHRAQAAFAMLDNDRNRVATWTWMAEAYRARQEWKEAAEYCCCALQASADLAAESRAAGYNDLMDEYIEWYQRIQQALCEALRYYVPEVEWAVQVVEHQQAVPGDAPGSTEDRLVVKQPVAHEETHKVRQLGENPPAPASE